MKHVATMMIAAALVVNRSTGSANAGWGKFWKKFTDEKCWKIQRSRERTTTISKSTAEHESMKGMDDMRQNNNHNNNGHSNFSGGTGISKCI